MLKAIIFLILTAVFFVFVIRCIAKVMLMGMNKIEKKIMESNNPYIKYHEMKSRNEDYYQQYQEWLKKQNASGAPVDKYVFPEDEKADKKIKQML